MIPKILQGLFPEENNDSFDLSFEDAIKLKSENPEHVHFIDVRTHDEYHKGHIAGAWNQPLDDLDDCLKSLPKDEKVLLYCRSGRRSGIAKKLFEEHGFTDVHNIGGILDYHGPIHGRDEK